MSEVSFKSMNKRGAMHMSLDTRGVQKKKNPVLVAGASMYDPGRNVTFFVCTKEHNLVLTVEKTSTFTARR